MVSLDARRRRTKWGLVNGLRLFWIVVVLWCEAGAFFWSLLDCRWPDKSLSTSLSASPTHVLLIADPQILDKHSYPGRSSWLLGMTQYIVDFNMRKAWNALLTNLHPHIVVFLGDMMDNGRSVDRYEYNRYYDRFKSIFRLDSSIPVYYLPGNHDVGLGHSSNVSTEARDRYQGHFGALNQRVDVGNHTTLLLLDAPALVDEDYRRRAAEANFAHWTGSKGGTIEFLKHFIERRPSGPIVLFSHIPLSRSDRASCGPLREKGTIRPGVGYGYQNLLLPETSSFILENIRPSVIFRYIAGVSFIFATLLNGNAASSGDDHDYCEHHHQLADGSTVREVTVKSFSMAMGIRRPGFQLLSLTPSTLDDVSCFLPDQIKIYTRTYAPLGLVTVFVLFFLNYRQQQHRNHHHRRCSDKGSQVSPAQLFFSSGPWSSSPVKHRHSPERGASSPIDMNMHSSGTLATKDSPRIGFIPLEGDEESQKLPTSSPKREHASFERGELSADACRTSWRIGGSKHRIWYARAVGDVFQVAWPPLMVYMSISLWLFWR